VIEMCQRLGSVYVYLVMWELNEIFENPFCRDV